MKVQLESKYVVISLCDYIQTLIVLKVHRNQEIFHHDIHAFNPCYNYSVTANALALL